jgi:hypothetical protein
MIDVAVVLLVYGVGLVLGFFLGRNFERHTRE